MGAAASRVIMKNIFTDKSILYYKLPEIYLPPPNTHPLIFGLQQIISHHKSSISYDANGIPDNCDFGYAVDKIFYEYKDHLTWLIHPKLEKAINTFDNQILGIDVFWCPEMLINLNSSGFYNGVITDKTQIFLVNKKRIYYDILGYKLKYLNNAIIEIYNIPNRSKK